MHCPKCGQQQISDETRFCSRCGFLLTGIAQIVANGGIVPAPSQSFFAAGSPRRRGVMQGAFIFMLSFLIVPIITMITVAMDAEPFAVVISAVLLTMGGLLRIAYALMFESGAVGGKTLEQNIIAASQQALSGNKAPNQLPAGQSISVSAYAPPATGAWRDTNDLSHPSSVTDGTTKLLQEEK
jgi:hypothetical protein